jgi:predicted ATPase
LLEAAAAAGYTTSPEVARQLLQQPGGMELRASDPQGFAEAMLNAHHHEYERFSGHAGPVLYDRGFPDVAGFLQVSGLPVSPAIDRACRDLRYSGPILRAPAWTTIYAPDAERIQDWDQAVASDQAVTEAWQYYGYAVVDLPRSDVATRLESLRKALQPAA